MRCKPLALLLLAFANSVQADDSSRTIGFVRDVLPVLTKSGCNGGACHGSFQGRGGFRLSLYGFNPRADYEALVQEARGRRVQASSPAHSLILRKATGVMAHRGGKRFDTASESYAILQQWLLQGFTPPRADDAVVNRLELNAAELVLRPGEEYVLQVRAVWSDGKTTDITRWAMFDSTAEHVATIAAEPRIKASAPGRAAITVGFLGKVAALPVTVPYSVNVAAAPPRHNWIDDLVIAEWQKVRLEPAPLAQDSEFLRRVHLDLIGTLPTVDEARAFLQSTDPQRRTKLIDELLTRPVYVDYWALKWGDLLRTHRRWLGMKGLQSFQGWLKTALRENKSMDAFVRELLTAKGNLYANGPVAFYFVNPTLDELAETTAQVFLGIRLQCAKCHHHPFEAWSQDDYHGLAAFFARVERKDTGDGGSFGGAQSLRLAASGAVKHPTTGATVFPRLLGYAFDAKQEDERRALAEWITDKQNPYFARNIVNRYWGYLFGRGLVEPIDDVRATNPASHPALLDALARDFAAHQYDVKHLLRTLCNARVYQLASELAPKNDVEGVFFRCRQPRRLPAEVLLDAINQAAGVSETFPELPLGTRALALPDPAIVSTFLDLFGRPQRRTTCECERPNDPDLRQVLRLANGKEIHQKVIDPRGRIACLLKEGRTETAILDDLYLATLSRFPTPAERAAASELRRTAPTPSEGWEDLLWTLLNCTEFALNH